MQPTSSEPNFGRRIKYLAGSLVLIGIIVLGLRYYFSFQQVAVTFDTQAVTSLSLLKTVKPGTTLTVGSAVQTIESNKSYRIPKGGYVLRPNGPKTHTADIPLVVGDSAVATTLDIDYSYDYLRQIYATQSSAIAKAVAAAYPKLASLYKIQPGNLYHHGEWYGTTLTYIGPDPYSTDTLRLVMHQAGTTWSSATNPPSIILSNPANPTIPANIIAAVNALYVVSPTQ
jgi:hypothetical protein